LAQLKEEAQKVLKTALGQQLAMKLIEKRANGFKANLNREMQEGRVETLPPFPRVYKLAIACSTTAKEITTTTTTTTKPPKVPRTPKRASTVERVALALSDRPQVELSPTGFATFLRLGDQEEDWDRVPDDKGSKEEKSTDAEKMTQEKGLLSGWFAFR
jgi:hypothetical protein